MALLALPIAHSMVLVLSYYPRHEAQASLTFEYPIISMSIFKVLFPFKAVALYCRYAFQSSIMESCYLETEISNQTTSQFVELRRRTESTCVLPTNESAEFLMGGVFERAPPNEISHKMRSLECASQCASH